MAALLTFAPADFAALVRPAVWGALVRRAKYGLAVAALGAAFSVFGFAKLSEPYFKERYPTVKAEKPGFFGGLFGKKAAAPTGPPEWQRRQDEAADMLALLWGAIAFLALWNGVGRAAEDARRRVQTLEQESSGLLAAQRLSDALKTVESAERWCADGAHRKTLAATAGEIRARLASQTVGALPAPGGTQLVGPADRTAILQSPSGTAGPAGRYQIRRLLGKGGMGEVYEALDMSLDRVVALKKLPAHLSGDAQFVTRFSQEAKALAKLSHPAIVQVFDILRDDQGVTMALEYVPGGDLVSLLEREGRLTPQRACEIAEKIADGLAFAHRAGIIHRDIKPHNILLTAAGEPKITDFGLAKAAGAAQLTVDGAILGSPSYMSPEQAEGKGADARSDVYAFGIMLFQMVSGRLPFEGATQEVLAQHLTQRVPSLPDIPADLDAVIHRCTARDPDARYADGAALAAALRRLRGVA